MTTTQIDRHHSAFWTIALAFGGVTLLTAGLIGAVEFALAGSSAWNAAPLAVFVAVSAGAGFAWRRLRTSARKREAALDAYAELEIARNAAHSRQRRDDGRAKATLQLNRAAALRGTRAPRPAPTRRPPNHPRAAVLRGTVRQREEASHATSV
ncbi:MAG: hypothetical protein L0Y71_23665 [Gemmataceae bacterium]|nr:hypothetical protein [Gemmataceae bacterium]